MTALTPFGDHIWTATGKPVESLGFRYPTRMAVIRLADGGLFLWSPVALDPDLRAQVDAQGEVRFIVTPTALHHRFLAEWRAAYPRATLHAAPGSRARREDISFDADLDETPPAAWSGQIDQTFMRNAIATEVVFFHRASGTVLIADLIQHFPRGWFTGWRAVIARLDGMTGPEPQVPQKFRAAFTDRRAARASLQRILAWPADRVLMAHAPPVETEGRAFIVRAFRWLR